jgi:hypothetical protein
MSSGHPTLKQKVKHEAKEMVELFVYLFFFFFCLAVYDMLLLNEYHAGSWHFALALVNALLITKVIMIGEYAKLGRRHENKPLIVSAVWKAFIFGLLVYAFHIVEEGIKRLVHGSEVITTPRELRFDQLAARSVVVFCIFVPLFVFRELRRAIGEEKFQAMLFGSGEADKSDHAGLNQA